MTPSTNLFPCLLSPFLFPIQLPTQAVTFILDQPFWGRRIYELGIGPKHIPVQELTVPKLVEGIKYLQRPEVSRQCMPGIHMYMHTYLLCTTWSVGWQSSWRSELSCFLLTHKQSWAHVCVHLPLSPLPLPLSRWRQRLLSSARRWRRRTVPWLLLTLSSITYPTTSLLANRACPGSTLSTPPRQLMGSGHANSRRWGRKERVVVGREGGSRWIGFLAREAERWVHCTLGELGNVAPSQNYSPLCWRNPGGFFCTSPRCSLSLPALHPSAHIPYNLQLCLLYWHLCRLASFRAQYWCHWFLCRSTGGMMAACPICNDGPLIYLCLCSPGPIQMYSSVD